MNTPSGIKLTPQGKRFGDVIRRELANPESVISRAVRNLNGWKHQVKNHPQEFRFKLEGFKMRSLNKTLVVKCGRGKNVDSVPICGLPDVSYWYKAEPEP